MGQITLHDHLFECIHRQAKRYKPAFSHALFLTGSAKGTGHPYSGVPQMNVLMDVMQGVDVSEQEEEKVKTRAEYENMRSGRKRAREEVIRERFEWPAKRPPKWPPPRLKAAGPALQGCETAGGMLEKRPTGNATGNDQ
jgi:hypothetical protein